MKILIPGSTGMVGRNIVEALVGSAHEILSPDRKSLNLFDENNVLSYLDTNKPDFIIHCAGKVGGIQANIEDPLGFYIENHDMGRNLILSAYKVGIPRLLNLGSSCMYRRNAPNPLKEEQVLTGELEPTNEGYALAKVGIQRLCSYIVKKNPTLQYKTLIPCNLYGRYDKFDPIKAHLIPSAIRKIHEAKINNEKSVVIWGDGTARREFLYAGDVADFIFKKLSCFDVWPELMNLSAVIDHTVTEYYEVAKDVIGYQGEFEFDVTKPVGMKQKLVDASLQRALGWVPPTSLHDGITKTYAYFL
jgi:GDP-L-fucose synthase